MLANMDTVDHINKGTEAENSVERVCNLMFLKDFVARNPIYTKSSGQTKEAADFLIPFGDQLLAFQVKSRVFQKPFSKRTSQDYLRLEKLASKGVDQLKTIKRALKAGYLKSIRNNHGIVLPFTGSEITTLIGVVILEIFGEESFSEDERTEIFNGFVIRNGIPTHIFSMYTFDNMILELDTLKDFIDFLMVRQELFSNDMVPQATSDLDLLTVYKTQYDTVMGLINSGKGVLLIEDGLWRDYRNRYADQITKRDVTRRPSYIVDDIISRIHTTIGFDPGTEDPSGTNESTIGTTDQYHAIAIELGKTSRLERQIMGEKFLEKLRKADKTGMGYTFIQSDESSGFFFLSTDAPRKKRVVALYNLGSIVYCGMNLSKLICICTEQLSSKSRSYDFLMLDGVKFENHSELAAKMGEVFGKHYTRHNEEFPK